MAQGGATKLEEFALQAFVHLIVYLIGAGVITAFYYNLYVLDQFMSALFWAVICSVPMFQVKMALMNCTKRLLTWLRSDSPKHMSEASPRREVLLPSAQNVIALHWLGFLKPYESVRDFLSRDIVLMSRCVGALLSFAFKPFSQFADEDRGSQPYFSLLLRLCTVQFCYKLLGARIILVVVAGLVLYVGLVALRLTTTIVALVAPKLVPLMKHVLLRSGVTQDSLDGIGSMWEHGLEPVFWTLLNVSWKVIKSILFHLAVYASDCHLILATLIILFGLVASYFALHLLSVALRHEAMVIGRLAADLRTTPLYRDMVSKVSDFVASSHDSDADLWGYGKSLVGVAAPKYQELLQHILPDDRLLKYVFSGLWSGSDGATGEAFSIDSFAALLVQMSPRVAAESEENAEACALARAMGASCEPAGVFLPELGVDVEEEPLKVVTLARMLLGGNFSAAVDLGPSAYAEIATLARSSTSQCHESEAGKEASGALGTVTMTLGVAALQTLGVASWALGQGVVFLTALFYLLSAKTSFLSHILQLFDFIDQDQVIAGIAHRAVQAVLLSPLKMSAFHALFTWLLYSWANVPIIVVPVALSALLALVPLSVPPVWGVSVWASAYLWTQEQKAAAVFAFALNCCVWWQVPTVIYAEIPEALPWLTGLCVVLGINQFGVSGVVLGPMLATIPLICFRLLTSFNKRQSAGRAHSHRRTPQGSWFIRTLLRSGDESASDQREEASASDVEVDISKGKAAAAAAVLLHTPKRVRRVHKGGNKISARRPSLHGSAAAADSWPTRSFSKERSPLLAAQRMAFQRKPSGSPGASPHERGGAAPSFGTTSRALNRGIAQANRRRAVSAGDTVLPRNEARTWQKFKSDNRTHQAKMQLMQSNRAEDVAVEQGEEVATADDVEYGQASPDSNASPEVTSVAKAACYEVMDTENHASQQLTPEDSAAQKH